MFSGRIIQLLLFLAFFVNLGLAHSVVGEGAEAGIEHPSLEYNTLGSLYEGNKRFRNTAGKRAGAGQLVEESPSFMFLGCTDNRLTPSSIFQAPVGSIIAQNNIGNQYSKKDVSTDAAVTYAIEELGVQHIIVLGHYGCTGVSKGITGSKKRDSVFKWISPIAKLYKMERRYEVVKFRDSRMPHRGLKHGINDPPGASEPGFRAFVEENVKETVKSLKEDSLLAKAYKVSAKGAVKKTRPEVYVHGFVFDEATGQVVDLQISFGPPGKAIPPVPFTATAAAKNFHLKKELPNFFRGKTLPKKQ